MKALHYLFAVFATIVALACPSIELVQPAAADVGPHYFLMSSGVSGWVTSLKITADSGQVAYLQLSTTDNSPIQINWGDATVTRANSGSQYSHTYSTPFSGTVILTTNTSARLASLTVSASVTAIFSYDLAALKNQRITTFNFVYNGPNRVTGNLSAISGATYVNIYGNNTVSGTIPSGATYVSISGNNTVSGTIPSGATYVGIYGNNTVSGTIPSGATTVSISGNNTVSGTIPSGATYVSISGNNTVTLPSSWSGRPSAMQRFYIRGVMAYSSSVVDAFLVAIAAGATSWSGDKLINIKGSRTSTSDAAVSTLQGRGVTVIVN